MYLLDTNLVLWTAVSPDRLSKRALALVASRDVEVAFSLATMWEVAIKTSLEKPGFKVDSTALRNGLLDQGFRQMDIRHEHIAVVARLLWHHRDPFDRLLVAQALVEGRTLLTSDRLLARYGKMVKWV
ncbi:MAG: type II toxin-antitoxin system VapC family toxin [Rubrivivax sp.]